eukprot:scaffold2119_cov355-Prasinococcus_capsulatus_cf.AAC.6
MAASHATGAAHGRPPWRKTRAPSAAQLRRARELSMAMALATTTTSHPAHSWCCQVRPFRRGAPSQPRCARATPGPATLSTVAPRCTEPVALRTVAARPQVQRRAVVDRPSTDSAGDRSRPGPAAACLPSQAPSKRDALDADDPTGAPGCCSRCWPRGGGRSNGAPGLN